MDIFNNEEKTIINKMTENSNVSVLTKDDLFGNLAFSLSITSDEDMIDLLNGLAVKIKNLSDSEWDSIKFKLPFDTDYDIN